MTICLAVLTEYRRVTTGRQTDRRTGILLRHGPRYDTRRAVKTTDIKIHVFINYKHET